MWALDHVQSVQMGIGACVLNPQMGDGSIQGMDGEQVCQSWVGVSTTSEGLLHWANFLWLFSQTMIFTGVVFMFPWFSDVSTIFQM